MTKYQEAIKRAVGWMGGVALAAAVLFTVPASALTITSGFTGNWADPESDGQGLQFEVVEVNGRTELFAIWFLFDTEGNLLWLYGLDEVVGDTATLEMFQPAGSVFGEPVTESVKWGEITVTFDTCNSGTLEFDAVNKAKAEQVGTGFKQLNRVTNIKASACSGGLSDDLGANVVPENFSLTLNPTDAAPGASGLLAFEVRSGHAELKLRTRGLPIGTYDLVVDGEPKASFQSVSDDSGNEGELELESPPGPGDELLDFDPRGKAITVERNGVVFLDGDLPDNGEVPGSGGDANPPPFGNSEVEFDLDNLGVYPLGDAEAELEQEPDRVDFKVEVEDVPVGAYQLLVGGENVGTINVVDIGMGTEGELEYRFPPEPGKELLDFDPRGQSIVIAENGTQLFSGVMPDTGAGGGDDDDDSGGGDNDDGDDDSGGGDDDDGGGGGGGEGDLELAVELMPTGSGGGASGDADYRRRDDRTEFKVEIEDVADGDYALRVGGVQRGVITVSAGEGEIEFRDPVEPGKELLDFDPLGKLIEVLDDGTVILQGTLPPGG